MRTALIIPTRNRPERLDLTLRSIGSLQPPADVPTPSVWVVDNASEVPPSVPDRLENGWPTRLIRSDRNLGAAARNLAAEAALNSRRPPDVLCLLDDDSYPTDTGFLTAFEEAPADLFALGAEIHLPSGRHEAGGLPEVFIGCGVLVRADRFVLLDGYDAAFGYYGEEYDLCARAIAAGWRVTHDRRFQVLHGKVEQGRNFARILSLLVRNNAWVIQRYAPSGCLDGALAAMLSRYREIALREQVASAFDSALADLDASLDAQPRTPLAPAQWDRFTGRAAVESSLLPRLQPRASGPIRLAGAGKGEEVIRAALDSAGISWTPLEANARPEAGEVVVPAYLSPGPLADAWLDLAARFGPEAVILPPCEPYPGVAERLPAR